MIVDRILLSDYKYEQMFESIPQPEAIFMCTENQHGLRREGSVA